MTTQTALPAPRTDTERRVAPNAPVEVRVADGKPPVITGYAAVFNDPVVIADLFREQIAPEAFDEALGRDDVRLLFNHEPDQVLARTTTGTLRLSVDARGLRYEGDLNPEDPDAQRVLAKIRRGDVSQSSFGFRATKVEWQEAIAPSLPLRIVRGVELFDVSPVTYPAYTRTSVSARDVSAHVAAAGDDAEARLRRRRYDE